MIIWKGLQWWAIRINPETVPISKCRYKSQIPSGMEYGPEEKETTVLHWKENFQRKWKIMSPDRTVDVQKSCTTWMYKTRRKKWDKLPQLVNAVFQPSTVVWLETRHFPESFLLGTSKLLHFAGCTLWVFERTWPATTLNGLRRPQGILVSRIGMAGQGTERWGFDKPF